jgi:hypothetical protein
MSTTMSAGVESNWNIVDNDGSLSTITRSVVGCCASKTGLVATISFLLNQKVFLEESDGTRFSYQLGARLMMPAAPG